VSDAEILALAGGLERGSEHPLAAAILAAAAERGVAPSPVGAFRSLTGRGVTGEAAGRRVALGNARLLEELGIDAGDLGKRAEALREEAQTVVFVTAGGAVVGILGVADPIKASARQAIRDLQGEGLRVVMVTGDSAATARAVARTSASTT
jgi:Cu+-exporting ATPase